MHLKSWPAADDKRIFTSLSGSVYSHSPTTHNTNITQDGIDCECSITCSSPSCLIFIAWWERGTGRGKYIYDPKRLCAAQVRSPLRT